MESCSYAGDGVLVVLDGGAEQCGRDEQDEGGYGFEDQSGGDIGDGRRGAAEGNRRNRAAYHRAGPPGEVSGGVDLHAHEVGSENEQHCQLRCPQRPQRPRKNRMPAHRGAGSAARAAQGRAARAWRWQRFARVRIADGTTLSLPAAEAGVRGMSVCPCVMMCTGPVPCTGASVMDGTAASRGRFSRVFAHGPSGMNHAGW